MANGNGQSAIRSYRDLRVWQTGMEIAEACYQLTGDFPKQEIYGMTSQIRRASTSIPANIAEGHGRETRGELIQFLRSAQGSLKELETHLLLSVRLHLATESATAGLLLMCDAEGKQLRALIRVIQSKQRTAT